MRVLVIEDDASAAAKLARQLGYAGLDVDTSIDGVDGFERARSGRYDVVVLERDLPGMSGDEICWRLRSARHSARVLMLTVRRGLDELVAGLELGADDYLTKPFAEAELLARVRALGRRQVPATPVVLRCGDVELNSERRSVLRAGERVELTNKEFRLLETLLKAEGAVVSNRELLEGVWGDRVDAQANAVRVTMRTLRVKLGSPGILHTVIGAGYRAAPHRPAPDRGVPELGWAMEGRRAHATS